ncbi:MAG: hypothetical protein GEV03_09055 [Streptosporangiales bacterium]|nr:hypothetical protein [Streptosporangiales bacterium]
MTLDQFVQALVSGALLGTVYAALALGLSLVLGVLGIINVAHSALLIFASLMTWQLVNAWGLDPFLALVVVVVLLFAVGGGIERTLVRKLARESDLTVLLVFFGLMVIVESVAILRFSTDTYSVSPGYLAGTVSLGPANVPIPRLVGAGLTLALMVGLHLFLTRTLTGTAIRAIAQNRDVASLVGIRVSRLRAYVFAGGVALAGFGGVVLSFNVPFSPQEHVRWLAWAFLLVIVGGLGSVLNTLLAGLLLGIAESLAGTIIPFRYVYLAVYALLVVALVVRNQGLRGTATRTV